MDLQIVPVTSLNPGQGNANVEGTILEVGETRTFNKYGRDLSVANAVLKDASGTIKLTLWNDDTKRFKEGDKVRIVNGYVNEFQGEKQLTSGKFGKMEKIEETSKPAELTPEQEDVADSLNKSETIEGIPEKKPLDELDAESGFDPDKDPMATGPTEELI
ncbi:hypothetical protein GOV14_05930 [Candidatus Pacearchaeota archaeon]|nr:hypothetical protein [Candidatus Pacearchaeota archaeon]